MICATFMSADQALSGLQMMTTTTLSTPTSGLSLSPTVRGMALGLLTAIIWGANQSAARYGIANGLGALDIAALRFGTAGLVLAPWLMRQGLRDAAGVGWGRALIVALLIGPLFFALNVGGYAYAPLAHGAVILPASFTIASLTMATLFLGERQTPARLAGVATMIVGIATIAGTGLRAYGKTTPYGDAMFMAAGLLWAAATIAIRRWQIPPLHVAALVASISAAIFLPLYLALGYGAAILAAPIQVLATEIIIQGLLAGIVAVLAFTRSVELLGASRAAVFPALVPVAAILIGIPMTGELPSVVQLAGLTIVTLGLIIAAGVKFPSLEGIKS
jgi:drug/metabolite transporter (DMT)-like permease